MKQLSKHVYQISLGAVNTFVITDEEGMTLVDTGYENSKDKIFAAIREGGKKPEDIRRIILTHSHPDHSGSAADIKHTLNVPVFAHEEDAILLEAGIGGRLPHVLSPGIANWVIFHAYIKNSPNKIELFTVDKKLKNGDVLPFAGRIEVIHTPGHSKGHISLLVRQEEILIAGDICANMLGLDYSTVYEDRRQAVKSILKVADYDFETAVFGHGRPLIAGANRKLEQKFAPTLAWN
jgi:glyoxylase-like metal-dependent hydrolase (beta-lactamase superfamily II)